MYERSVEEIMDDWDAMAQERQELQAIRVRYRNCRSLLSKRNIDRTPVRVVVPFKERGIPVEYLKMLSTPLAVLEITPRSRAGSGSITSICWKTFCALSRRTDSMRWQSCTA